MGDRIQSEVCRWTLHIRTPATIPANSNTATINDIAIRVPRLMDQTIHEHGTKVNNRYVDQEQGVSPPSHGGYENGGVRDVWLWSPDVLNVVIDLPLTRFVLDMEHEELGVLVAGYTNGYRHPTAESYLRTPTHYTSASL